jgi:hypothetical protein
MQAELVLGAIRGEAVEQQRIAHARFHSQPGLCTGCSTQPRCARVSSTHTHTCQACGRLLMLNIRQADMLLGHVQDARCLVGPAMGP